MVVVVVQRDGPDRGAVRRSIRECDYIGDIGPIVSTVVLQELLTGWAGMEQIEITIGVVIDGG